MSLSSFARAEGARALQRQIAERSPSATLPGWKSYKFESQLCFFCHRHGEDLRTGYLPLDGPVWQCAACRWEYQAEKAWQTKSGLIKPMTQERASR